eukprot:TCONS_00036391-protein
MILGQFQNNKERVISYGGRALNKAERNYSTTEQEALAVVAGVKKYLPYLHGRSFTVHTDHSSLRWLLSLKEPRARLARWILTLQQHDFDIKHRPGRVHDNADVMSRHPNFVCALSSGYLPETIKEMQYEDPALKFLIFYILNERLHSKDRRQKETLSIAPSYLVNDYGILHHVTIPSSGRKAEANIELVVPKRLQQKVLIDHHDSVTGGHFDADKTYKKIRSRYFWKNMYADCQRWVKSCPECASYKLGVGTKRAPLKPLPIPAPFDRLAVDITGPFPVSDNGNKYILVATDHFTRWPEAFPIPTAEAPVIARIFFNEIVCRHGAPSELLSDRGTNFLSKLLREVCRITNTQKINTSSYHPQTNGMCERLNGTLVKRLAIYCGDSQKDWDTYIPGVLLAIRTTASNATKKTPFFLTHGREARLPGDIALLPPTKLAEPLSSFRENIVETLQIAQDEAKEQMEKSQKSMKKNYDKKASVSKFSVGDKILLKKEARKKGLSPKLQEKYIGPFILKQKLSDVLFFISDMSGKVLKAPTHVNRMKPFDDPDDAPIRQNANQNDDSEDEIPLDTLRKRLRHQPKVNTLTATNKPKLTINSSKPGLASRSLLALLVFVSLFSNCTSLNLGPIFDCTKVKPAGIYRFPTLRNCTVPNSDEKLGIQKYEGEVFLDSPKYTPIKLYHCEKSQATLSCEENFFGERHKKIRRIKVSTTPKECRRVWRAKTLKNDFVLKQTSDESKWELDVTERYDCTWMRTKTRKFFHYSINIYKAFVVGGDVNLHQSLTTTSCPYNKTYCRPQEAHGSIIVWTLPKNLDTKVFHSLGKHIAERTGSLILIRSLKIGGSIQLEKKFPGMGRAFVLDNGYLFKAKHFLKGHFELIKASARRLSMRKPEWFAASLLEAQLAAVDQQQRLNLIHAWNAICQDEMRIQKLERWVLSTFPGSSNNFLGTIGQHFDLVGDGLSIGNCFPVTSYSIYWDRQWNGTCYSHFPVRIPYSTKLLFLDVPSRSLLHTSQKINCDDRPETTYVVDVNQRAFVVGTKGTVTPAVLSNLVNRKEFQILDLVIGFDSKAFARKPPRLDQYSILQLLTLTSQSLNDMHEVATTDSDSDFISNFGMALGYTIEKIGDGSSKIIRSIGSALKDGLQGAGDLDKAVVGSIADASKVILPATGELLKDAGTGAGNMISGIFGGPLGLVQVIVLILLFLFTLYLYYTKQTNYPLATNVLRRFFPAKQPENIYAEVCTRSGPLPSAPAPVKDLESGSQVDDSPKYSRPPLPPRMKSLKALYPNLRFRDTSEDTTHQYNV